MGSHRVRHDWRDLAAAAACRMGECSGALLYNKASTWQYYSVYLEIVGWVNFMCFIVTIKKNNIPLSIKTTSSPEKKRENKSVAFTALVSEQEAFNSGVLGACGRESVFALKRHLTMPGGIFNCCTCRGCFWHLDSKDQGSCEIAYNAQDHNLPTSKELPHHNTSSAA